VSFFADANVCASPFGFKHYSLSKKHLIVYGIDTTKFKPITERENNAIPQILFVGRLVPEKGCDVLIEAMKDLKREKLLFTLSICGDGFSRQQLQSLVSKHELNSAVTFCGGLYGQNLIRIMQQSDIAVVPSLWDEYFGLTAIEAMSCGLPVIASNVGGLGGIVSETGFVFERGDVHGLSLHLKRLLCDEALRKEASEKSRSIAMEKYDWERMGGEYYMLFSKLLKN
jgi:glycosyltransferase involved in cell wall biosynthesis